MKYRVSTENQPALEFSISNPVLMKIAPARFLRTSSEESL